MRRRSRRWSRAGRPAARRTARTGRPAPARSRRRCRFRPIRLPWSWIGCQPIAGDPFQQRADAGEPSPAIGRRRQVGVAKDEFLVLGADAPCLARLAAGGDIVGEVRAERDRRGVGVSGVGHRSPLASGRRRRSRLQGADACSSASPAMAAVSARRMRGPSDTGVTKGRARKRQAPLGVSRPPGRSAGAARIAPPAAGRRRRSIAPRQQMRRSGRPGASRSASARLRRMRGHGQPLALLRRLDGDGGQPVEVDPRGLGARGHHRQDRRCAQFGGLFAPPGRWRRASAGRTQPADRARSPAARRSDAARHRRTGRARGRQSAPAIRRRAPLNKRTASPAAPAHDVGRDNAPAPAWRRSSRPPCSGAATNRRIDPEHGGGHITTRWPRAFTDIRAAAGSPACRRPGGPYALLGRLDRPIGAWLLFLPGLWGILLAGAPAWRAALWLIAPVRGRRRGHARRRLRGERPVGPRSRPDGGRAPPAGRWPPASLRSGDALVFLAAAAGDRPAGALAAESARRRRWAWPRCCWWRCIRWPSGSPGGRNSCWASPSAGARRWAMPPPPAGSTAGAAALRRRDLLDPRLRHDLRPSGPRGRRAGRRELDRPAVRPPHAALPGRSATRRRSRCWCWPAAGRCSAWFLAGLALPAALLARQSSRSTSTTRSRCLVCSRRTRRSASPSPSRSWWGGCEKGRTSLF